MMQGSNNNNNVGFDPTNAPLDVRSQDEAQAKIDYAWDTLLMTIMSVTGFGVHVIYWREFQQSDSFIHTIAAILISLVAEIAAWAIIFRFARVLHKSAWVKGRALGSFVAIVTFTIIASIYCGFAILGSEMVAKVKTEKPTTRLLADDKSDVIIAQQQKQIEVEESKHTNEVAMIKTSYANKHKNTNGASWVYAERDKKLQKEQNRHNAKMEQLTADHAKSYTSAVTARDNGEAALATLLLLETQQYLDAVDTKKGWLKYLTICTFLVFSFAGISAYRNKQRGIASVIDPAIGALPESLHNMTGGLSILVSYPMNLIGNVLRKLDLRPNYAVAFVDTVSQQPQRQKQPQSTSHKAVKPQATMPQDAPSHSHNGFEFVAQQQPQPTAPQPTAPQSIEFEIEQPQPHAQYAQFDTPTAPTHRDETHPHLQHQTIVHNIAPQTILAGPRATRDNTEQGVIRRHLDAMAYSATASKEVLDNIKAAKANHSRIPTGNNQTLYNERCKWLLQHGIRMQGATATIA
jgi:hypothetical protein